MAESLLGVLLVRVVFAVSFFHRFFLLFCWLILVLLTSGIASKVLRLSCLRSSSAKIKLELSHLGLPVESVVVRNLMLGSSFLANMLFLFFALARTFISLHSMIADVLLNVLTFIGGDLYSSEPSIS